MARHHGHHGAASTSFFKQFHQVVAWELGEKDIFVTLLWESGFLSHKNMLFNMRNVYLTKCVVVFKGNGGEQLFATQQLQQ